MPKSKKKDTATSSQSDAWDTLCGTATVEGRQITLDDLAQVEGAPGVDYLNAMINLARGLKLEAATKDKRGRPNQGIAFTVQSVNGERTPAIHGTGIKVFQDRNKSAAVCYENAVLPHDSGTGHLVVRQSLVPCTRCRAGYKAWAKQRQGTIIVECDKGYDRTPDDTTFIFTPGDAAYITK